MAPLRPGLELLYGQLQILTGLGDGSSLCGLSVNYSSHGQSPIIEQPRAKKWPHLLSKTLKALISSRDVVEVFPN